MTLKYAKNNSLFKLSLLVFALQTACSLMPFQDVEKTKAVGENSVFNVDRTPAFVDLKNNGDKKSIPLMDKMSHESQADYHFALAETYSFEGITQKAIEEFKTTLIYDPNSQVVRVRLATEYAKLGLSSEAIDQAEQALKINPKNAETRLLLGGLYSTAKLFDKSIEQYQEVIKINPQNASEANLYLGAIYAEKNKFKESLGYFEKASKDKNSKFNHLAHYYAGKIYNLQGKTSLAEKSFQASLISKHDFSDGVLALGELYENTKRSKKAIDLYTSFQDQYGPDIEIAKVLSQHYLENEELEKAYRQYEIVEAADGQNLNIKIRLALIDIERKEYESAIKRLNQILGMAPDSDKVRFYLAAVYEELGKNQEAIREFKQIPSDSQFYSESIVHAAYLYRENKQIKEALNLSEGALKKKTNVAQLYALHASLLDEAKEYKRAEEVLESGTVLFPEDEQLMFFLGSIQDKRGEKEKMTVSMKKVLGINSEHVQALNYLAYTYAESGKDLDDAEKMARKALKLKPDDAFIKDTLGWVLYKKGNFKEAVQVLELAHQIKPDEGIIAEHLGDAYYQYQLFTKAKDMYERAAQVEKNEVNVKKIESKLNKVRKLLSDSYKRVPASY